MAGPMVHINYVSDDGTTYRVLVPSWQQAATGDVTPATATAGLPKGYKRRHRQLLDAATGRQIKMTVGHVGSTVWTAGFGASVSVTFPNAAAATTLSAQGRIGERDLVRG